MRYVQAWFLALALCLTSTAAPDLYADTIYYYMAKSDGSWSSVGIWYTNTTGGTDPAVYTTPASEAPDSGNSRGIIVNADVAFDDNVTIDQTTVNAGKTLTVNENILMTVADGSGPDLVVPGTLAIAGGASVDCQGSFNATGGAVTFTGPGDLYLSGELVSLGTLTPNEGTVGFAGSTAQTITGSNTFFNLIIDKENPTDTVNATGSTLTVTNGLMVTTGVFTSASDLHDVLINILGTLELSGDITVSGEWWNTFGTFTHNNHTVTLDGTEQFIFGSTTFHNLSKSVTSADTLTFEDGSTTTIEGTLTLGGASGQLLSLRSADPGTQWRIDPQGARNIAYVDVQDSNNFGTVDIQAANSVDSGNNLKWVFVVLPTVTTQAVTNIGQTTATGNGNITDLGVPDPTAHGVCWNTTGTPTVNDDKKDNGAASQTGEFTADITGLTPGTTYYVRAFATNTAGTAYGDQVEFKSKAALTMAVSPAGSGTTTPAAGSTANVDAGVAQNITATAETGWQFVNWTADPAGNATFGDAADPTTTVTLTGSATVTANFSTSTVTLTTAANPAAGGTVTRNPDKSVYDVGENVQVTATANANYVFTGWSGDATGTDNPVSVSMTGNKSVTANFAPGYSLTYNGNGNTGGTAPTDAKVYQEGAEATVLGANTLTRTGYTFNNWNTAADGSGTSYAVGAKFNMPGTNVTLYAQWTAETYTVAFDANGGTTPVPATKQVTYGEAYGDLAATIREGYSFNGWFTAATGGTQVTSATTVSTASNHTLYAQWTGGKFTLTVSNGTGSGEYDVGAVVSVAANPPAEGKVFDQWTGDVAHVANVNLANTTVTMPEANVGVTATYKDKPADKFTLTVNSGTGSGEYEVGGAVSIAANPAAEGKVFDVWTGQTANVANVNLANTTVTMPDANVSLTATYKDKPAETFTLTVDNGTGSGQYEAGTVVAIAADPAADGMMFDKWIGQTGMVSNINAPNTTLTMPGSSVVVKAVYKAEPAIEYKLLVQSGTGSGEYKAGRIVTIAATPAASGYIFDKWTGQTANVVNVCIPNTIIIMPGSNVSVRAIYKVDPGNNYNLDVRTQMWALLDRKMSRTFSSSAVENVPAGKLVTLIAPDAPTGYVFDIWTGQTSNVANVNLPETILYMPDTNVVVIANYRLEQDPATLTVASGTGSGTYAPNTVVDIAANDPPADQMFDKWTGQTGNVENINLAETRIVMPSTDVSIQAAYQAKTVATFALAVTSGTGDGDYLAGIMVDIAADAPPAGQVFDKWVGQIATVENINSASTRLYMPPNEVAVTASYKTAAVTTYTLTTAAAPAAGGSVAKVPDKTSYDAGESVQVTATANAGYVFTSWSGDLSGTTNPAAITMDGNKQVSAEFGVIQALVCGKASSFKVTITKIEMLNGTVWTEVFSGSAQLDMVSGGTFPGIGDLELPPGTYSKIRFTFKNAFPTSGTVSCGGTHYYSTGDTYAGEVNLQSRPTTNAGSMAPYTFQMAAWGALNADVAQEFDITPITVRSDTNYQPTLRFTLSNRLCLMGAPGSPGTYYFVHKLPVVRVVE